jgi:hypothetical protein
MQTGPSGTRTSTNWISTKGTRAKLTCTKGTSAKLSCAKETSSKLTYAKVTRPKLTCAKVISPKLTCTKGTSAKVTYAHKHMRKRCKVKWKQPGREQSVLSKVCCFIYAYTTEEL